MHAFIKSPRWSGLLRNPPNLWSPESGQLGWRKNSEFPINPGNTCGGGAHEPESDPEWAYKFSNQNTASLYWHQLYLRDKFWVKKKVQIYVFARQRKQADTSKPCPGLRGDSKGFIGLVGNTVYMIKMSTLFSLHGSLQGCQSSVIYSSDRFWLSLCLWFLGLPSGRRLLTGEWY